MEDNKQQEVNVEITEEIADGVYSNLAIISHSPSEVVLDFISLLPGVVKTKVKSRIIMNPQHAKKLLYALEDNLKKYEKSFGKIEEVDTSNNLPLNFGGPTGQA